MSGFVTETTYNQGQAAQDAKINALTGKIADINYLAFLDAIYPEDNVITGTRLDENTLYPKWYEANTSITWFFIPVIVPYIVQAFPTLWTENIDAPTEFSMYDATGIGIRSEPITRFEIKYVGDTTFFAINFATPINVSTSGIYHFKLHSTNIMEYHWTKNATPFSSLA